MKKIITALILCFAFASNVFGAELNVINSTLTNTGVMDEDEGYTFTYDSDRGDYGIINVGEDIYVDSFNKDGSPRGSHKIKITEEKFGGYAYDGTNHYFLFGNSNPNSSNSTTIYKLVKYNQSFNKSGSATLRGSQVYAKDIFLGEGSLCDMRIDGDHLYINDVVLEYTYENKNYKNNRSYVFDRKNLKLLNSVGGMSLAKNKGVRNQVIENMSAEYDNKYYFAVNSKTGIYMFEIDPALYDSVGNHTVKNLARSGLSSYYADATLREPGNLTTLSLEGFEAGKSHFIAVGTETDTEAGTRIFISSISKEQLGSIKPKNVNLTEYGDISNVKVVKISDQDILIMWEENNVINYCHLDGNGELNGGVKKIFGAELGEADPCANKDGAISWAYMVNDDDFAYYTYSFK